MRKIVGEMPERIRVLIGGSEEIIYNPPRLIDTKMGSIFEMSLTYINVV